MKKTTPRRAPKKIRNPQKKSYKKLFTTIIIIATSILLGLAIGNYYGTQIDNVAHEIKDIATIDVSKPKEKEITFEEKTRALEIAYADTTDHNTYIEQKVPVKQKQEVFHFEEPNLEEIDKKDEQPTDEPSMLSPEIIKKPIIQQDTIKKEEVIPKIKAKKEVSNKPKLAIIIDDMTTQHQINSVLNLGYTVNMAFLPPTSGHRNSAKITQSLENIYMIHLPLQASNSRYEEENTLHINDSITTIENRIKYLRTLYPNTQYLNNHTGSKFTSNQAAMDKLFEVLKRYNYTFIDSRTTAKSVAEKSSKKYGVKMFSRNIFLDNKKDKTYIQNQLKKAIKSAKKNGMAIAIGHPYSITFQTLKESKYLLKDLELVYINKL
ncbi:MAG: divergent polysaccharide deacetylase family protein [Arcobacteraceae bacterium]